MRKTTQVRTTTQVGKPLTASEKMLVEYVDGRDNLLESRLKDIEQSELVGTIKNIENRFQTLETVYNKLLERVAVLERAYNWNEDKRVETYLRSDGVRIDPPTFAVGNRPEDASGAKGLPKSPMMFVFDEVSSYPPKDAGLTYEQAVRGFQVRAAQEYLGISENKWAEMEAFTHNALIRHCRTIGIIR